MGAQTGGENVWGDDVADAPSSTHNDNSNKTEALSSSTFAGVECAVKQLEGALNDAKPKSGVWDIRVLMALRQHMQAGVSVRVLIVLKNI